MTTPIGRGRRFGMGSDPPAGSPRTDTSTEQVVSRLISIPRLSPDEAVIIRAERVYNQPLAVSAAERTVETQQSAVEAIRAARTEQVRILSEAEDLALSSRLSTLNTQRTTQETEITRIKNAASFNGTNLFSDGALDLSITDISRNINDPTVLATSSGAAGYISTRIATPTLAATVKTTTEQLLTGLAAFAAGITSTARKVSGIVEKEDPNVVADQALAEAQSRSDAIDPAALASALAAQITDPYLTERSRQAIIDTAAAKLEPTRVKRLLEEDEEAPSTG